MLFVRLKLAAPFLLGALALSAAPAVGQTARRIAQGDTSSRAALAAERRRVHAELELANAAIDVLKRSGRSLHEDFQLRERLADAEALARRLTELDARLGAAAIATAHGPGAEQRVFAAAGPNELEAKADILADQAQRIAARGDALLGRARDVRARQKLRRCAGQMERDPFSPLEGSKRRAMTANLAVGSGATAAAPGSADIGLGAAALPSGKPLAPSASSGSGQLASTTSIGITSGSAVFSPIAPPTPTSSSDAPALSVQLRDVLDPTALAEIQHLEVADGRTSVEVLERAGAALEARADRLRQLAASLRARQHAAP
jgi:hypothetical protein